MFRVKTRISSLTKSKLLREANRIEDKHPIVRSLSNYFWTRCLVTIQSLAIQTVVVFCLFKKKCINERFQKHISVVYYPCLTKFLLSNVLRQAAYT